MTNNADGTITLAREDQICFSVVYSAIQDNLLTFSKTLREMSMDESGNVDTEAAEFFSYAAGTGVALLAEIGQIVAVDPDSKEYSDAFEEMKKKAKKIIYGESKEAVSDGQ